MDVQVRGSKVAKSNISTAANMLSIAEGDLDVIHDNLARIRDLTVQASNGIYDKNSIDAIKSEVQARLDEIDRVAAASNFNGMKLLDGSLNAGIRLQVGANAAEDTNSITIAGALFQTASTGATGLNIELTTQLDAPDDAAGYLDSIDAAITKINTTKAAIGSTGNRLDAATDSLTTTIENLTAAHSTIMDADIAEEAANFTKYQILQQTSSSL